MKKFTKLSNQIRETHRGVLTLLLCLMGMLFTTTVSAQIALRSSQTNTSTSTTVTVTKPTGLAVGDLMLANIVQSDDNDNQVLSDATLAGWTLVAGREFGNVGSDSWWGTILYKVAAASDVAATNFTFTGDADSDDMEAGIAAFSGVAVTGGVSSGPFDVVPGTINIANNDDLSATAITTATANAAVMMFGMIGDNRNVDSWTATSPTTLAEIFDVPFNAGLDMGMGMAWALKTTAGSTGLGAGELSGNENDPHGSILIALRPCTATPTVTPVSSILPVCFSASAQTTTMPYSAATNSPTAYSIDWNAAANTAGLLDQDVTAHTFVGAGGIMPNVSIQANVAAGTYNGTLSIITAGGCRNTSAVSVTVLAAPTASAGSPLLAICLGGTSAALGGSVGGSATGGTWSSSAGGTFNPNATTLNATWTPLPGYSGTATLTLTTSGGACGTTTASKTQLVNAQPTAAAGGTQTICVGGTAIVSGASSSNGTISWGENGAGSITANGSTLTPTYTSLAGDSGNTVTLTMTVSNSPCAVATANYSVVVNPLATVNANADQTICATTPNVTLAGSIGGSATSATWSGGTGTFSPDNTTLNTTYTPSAAEFLAGGNITLTLTTNDPAGPCNAVSDTMVITIRLSPTASAGGTVTICPGAATTVSGASASNGTISWTENGAGTITAGGTSLAPTYTSVAGDAGSTVTLTMTVTNSPCATATATYTVVVSPAAPNAAGAITGSASVCAGETTLAYTVAAVTNATNYTWTVPSGWSITDGQGTASITATAGGAGTGDITVVASNSCGSTNPQTVINIFPSNATNNTGFVTSSAKTDNGIQCNNGGGERRGFIKFPLTAIPAGATIVSSTLRLTNNNSITPSGANNDVKPLGNTDPVAGTSTASVLFNAIGAQNSGTFYSRTTWSNTGVITLALGSNATTDIQSRFASPGYIAMGLARGGTGVFNLFGYSSGANAPRLDVTYSAPQSLSITINPLTTTGDVTTSICAGETYVWPANGASYTTEQINTTFVSGCNTATLNLTVNPLTTNGDVTTSICSGDTYVWPANGASYTTTQSGTTFVSGCNTATLNLNIIPSTTVGSLTTTACDTYTWAENSQTYAATGVYTHVVGCNTATLDLTIVPSTTVGSLTTSACDTYTWAENSQTYTTSGVYVNVVGCNTATLDLAIIPSTTIGSETVNACITYTWAENGQTYNSSGVYTNVVGCNTATLTLTVNTTPDTFYADTDGDGFGTGAAILSCTGQPANTSTNNTDCAPGDASKWRTANFFIDVDGDSFNNGFPAVPVCYGATVPSGYVASFNGVDCDDSSASVHPNASEVLGNSIDDNCDGVTDEVTQTSNLIASHCGITLTNLANTLFAYDLATFVPQLGPIQGYRFRVTNGATVRTFDSPNVRFNLTNLPGGATYGTAYTVEVSVKSGGFYRAYGAPCIINTPAVPNATFVVNPISGSTLSDISNSIFCQQVPTASGYRFRVKNGDTVVGTYSSPISRFSLVNLGISNIDFGTTYTIDVLLKFGNDWRPDTEYGPAALISTPATPGTSRVIRPTCGTTINALWTTIFAQQIIGAQGYKFVVTNGVQTREFATANPRFQLPLLSGGAAASTAYTIRVDVLYNSSYVEGTVLCTLTTSPTASRQTNSVVDIYEVNATPNPFAQTFKLNVNTSSEDQVGVRVYDMLGREVEARQASVAAITNLEIGSQYPSGVYNIIVTQGAHVKSLRVIKR